MTQEDSRNIYYLVHTDAGAHAEQHLDNAIRYYKMNDGFMITTVSKDLFPTREILLTKRDHSQSPKLLFLL